MACAYPAFIFFLEILEIDEYPALSGINDFDLHPFCLMFISSSTVLLIFRWLHPAFTRDFVVAR